MELSKSTFKLRWFLFLALLLIFIIFVSKSYMLLMAKEVNNIRRIVDLDLYPIYSYSELIKGGNSYRMGGPILFHVSYFYDMWLIQKPNKSRFYFH